MIVALKHYDSIFSLQNTNSQYPTKFLMTKSQPQCYMNIIIFRIRTSLYEKYLLSYPVKAPVTKLNPPKAPKEERRIIKCKIEHCIRDNRHTRPTSEKQFHEETNTSIFWF